MICYLDLCVIFTVLPFWFHALLLVWVGDFCWVLINYLFINNVFDHYNPTAFCKHKHCLNWNALGSLR
jgi:hypothetical protein